MVHIFDSFRNRCLPVRGMVDPEPVPGTGRKTLSDHLTLKDGLSCLLLYVD